MAIELHPPTPVIPLDIFELITEILATSSDFASIRSLCLVNKSLVHFCRKHIFGRLKIKPRRWNDRPLQRFMPVYFGRQTIATYIRDFKFWVDMHDHRSLHAVSSLLGSRHLKNVRSFSLAFTEELSLSPIRKEMKTLPDEFISALCKFITVNPLEGLELWQINDVPITLFTYLPRLQELLLYNVGVTGAPVPKSLRKRPTRVPRLRKLYLKRNIGGTLLGILNQKTSVLDISRLEDLSLYIEDEYGKLPTNRLFSIPKRLKKLKVGGSSPRFECIKGFAHSLDAGTLRTLTTLEFSVGLTIWGQDPFVNILDELSAISGQNIVKTLLISLTVDWDIRCSVSSETWGRLESVLVPQGSFPALKRVDLDITITQYDSPDYEVFKMQLEEIGKKQFTRLRQIVDLKFEVDVTFVQQVVE